MRPARLAGLLLLLGLLSAAGFLTFPSSIPVPAGISGRVWDGTGPVAGARVRVKGQRDAVLSGLDGRFLLPPAPEGSGRVTAWKEGFFIAGVPADRLPLDLPLTRLPAEDNEEYAWVDPVPNPARAQNCGNCHGEIYREWSASGHARSVTNRRFRNLYDGSAWDGTPGVGWGLLPEHPNGAGVCSSCHAPTVAFSDPAYFDLRRARGVDARGVHCDYCHKVADVDGGTVGLTHGRFNLKLLRPQEGQLFFGPLDDVDRQEDAFAPLYRESRYCASCHEGTVFGVHVYGTYSEWLASPAAREGKQCQTCHMAPTGALTNVAPGKGGVPRDPNSLGNHTFFAGTRADMLRRCLKVNAGITAGAGRADLEVEVVADLVGHRVPTGFVDRNLLLVAEGFAADGTALAPSAGPTLPGAAGKPLAGKPGKLYAKLLKGFDGHSPAPFWSADPEAVDTRLFPGRGDRTVFTFPRDLDRVRVRLIYRRFWQEVAESKGWPADEVVVVDQTLVAGPKGERAHLH